MFQDNSKNSKQMFIIVFVAMVIGQAASTMVFMFVPLHLTTKFNLDFSVISNVTTTALFLSIVFTLVGGWLTDVIGRVRTIFIGVLLGAISSGLMIFIPTWQITSIAYVLSIIAGDIIAVGFWVLVIENSSWKNRGLFIGLAWGVKSYFDHRSQDFATGLINSVGERATEVLGLLVFIFAIILLAWSLIRYKPQQNFIEPKISNSVGGSPYVIILLWALSVQVISQFCFGLGTLSGSTLGFTRISKPLGLDFEQGSLLIKAQFAFAGTLIMLLAMTFSGWLSDKFGERKILIPVLLLAGIGGFVPFIMLGDFSSLLSQIVIIGLCRAMFTPAINSFLSKRLPEEKRGLIYGLFSGAAGVFLILLMPLQDSISERDQATLPLVLVLLLACAFLVWWKLKLPVQSESPVGNVLQE